MYLLPPETIRPNTIHQLDALALLGALPSGSVSLIATDPPYGLGGRVFDFPHKQYSAVNESWDMEAPISWMSECERVLRPGGSVLCFGVRRSIYLLATEGLRLGWKLINDITWYKPNAVPNFTGRMMTESTERALWFCPSGSGWTYNLNAAKTMNGGRNLRDVWKFGQTRGERLHPTQKPLELMERIILLLTNEGDLVVDPFAGSGTTLDAARIHARRWIGGDTDTDYVAKARRRLAQPYTLPMFAEAV